jgi:hypothetical protein
MADLSLSPVGEDWIDKFDQTVDSPLDVTANPPDELEEFSQLRVWGTTEGEGEQERTTFEAMNSGDAVLFIHDSEFITSGRVGETVENPELGEWIWGALESRFVYTVTDYQTISVPRHEVWDLLGYSENYPLYGFSKASDDAISSLLQTYNSVEEAFQALRSEGTTIAESDTEASAEPADENDDDG